MALGNPKRDKSGKARKYTNTRIGNQRKDLWAIKFLSHLLMTQMYVWRVHVLEFELFVT
jgi:hypothetical protein